MIVVIDQTWVLSETNQTELFGHSLSETPEPNRTFHFLSLKCTYLFSFSTRPHILLEMGLKLADFWADFWPKIYENFLVSKSHIILPNLARNWPKIGRFSVRPNSLLCQKLLHLPFDRKFGLSLLAIMCNVHDLQYVYEK